MTDFPRPDAVVSLSPSVAIGGAASHGTPFTFIAGPCVVEEPDETVATARALAAIAADRRVPYVFKASFDKANRTSGAAFRGLGAERGLETLARVRREVGCPVTTDVHETSQVERVAEVADLLQIPAFLSRQTDLIVAAARSGRAINVKKGQFISPWDAARIVEKIVGAGCKRMLLTERGTSFGYNNLVVDMRGLGVMRSFGCPIVYDAGHSVQRPAANGRESGGDREFIRPLARAAVAVGVDAIFLEVHPEPHRSRSDAATAYPLAEVGALLDELLAIHFASNRPRSQ